MEGLGILATMPILDLLEPVPLDRVLPKISEIKKVVASAYGITVADLESRDRHRQFAVPRKIAAALSREMTMASFPQIGKSFGKRDHTTILSAFRSIKLEERTNIGLANDLTRLRKAINTVVAERPPAEPVPLMVRSKKRKSPTPRPIHPVELAA